MGDFKKLVDPSNGGGGGGGGGWRDDFEMGGGSFMDCFSFSLIDLAKQLLGIRLASDWAMTII